MLYLAPLLLLLARGQGTVVPIEVHTDQPSHPISPNLFGVFFEEINHAGDGGLDAELLRNVAFHEPGTNGRPAAWSVIGADAGTVSLGTDGVLIKRATASSELVGVSNPGYWGVPVQAGRSVVYSVDAFSTTETPLVVRLVAPDGQVLGQAARSPGTVYGMVRGVIRPTGSAPDAHLEIGLLGTGQADIRSASLTPVDTYKGHGLRTDLATLVGELHPAFVRFPGGCYVEGGDYLADRFRWETTLAPPNERPGHRNATWGYWSSDGLGFHEYLQWCEDMGAQALFVVNCGFSHKETVPMDQLAPYLLSTFDALDYALGPADHGYGAVRASRGHPAPFPLKFLEIGNENGQGWATGGSPADYAAHYRYFAEKIKERYPQLTLIADTRVAPGAEMVDDHYYNSPDWFWRNAGIYDHASRSGPSVYVGEYAVTSNCGTGNLRAALAEAAFMTGLERNGDLVKMASYAPLFVNVNNRAWNPDEICFDGEHSYGTPSYYVQALYGANRGAEWLPTDYPRLETSERFSGGVGLGTWMTRAEYKDLSVTAGGKTVYAKDFGAGAADWKPVSGDWSTADGAYRQSSDDQNVMSLADAPSLAEMCDCTIRVKARKLGGAEGFLLLFHARDSKRYLWWNIGGWGDRETGVEATDGGGRSEIGRHVPFIVESGRWYDFRIELRGDEMQLFADGKLVQTVHAEGAPTLAVSATRASDGDLVLKVVNGADAARPSEIKLDGLSGAFRATVSTLTSPSLDDENSFEAPTHVAPMTTETTLTAPVVAYTFPARSLTILRLHRTGAG